VLVIFDLLAEKAATRSSCIAVRRVKLSFLPGRYGVEGQAEIHGEFHVYQNSQGKETYSGLPWFHRRVSLQLSAYIRVEKLILNV
jgi:hypothetical protein